jgi:hypothetical protein
VQVAFDSLQAMMMVFGALVLLAVLVPFILPIFLPLGIAFFWLRRRRAACSSAKRRLHNTPPSPVLLSPACTPGHHRSNSQPETEAGLKLPTAHLTRKITGRTRRYLAASRGIKRHEAVTRSPVVAAFSAVLRGLPVIRAYGAGARFRAAFLQALSHNGAWWFCFLSCARCARSSRV